MNRKDRILQEAEILSHSLLNDVNTRTSLSSGVSHSTLMRDAGLDASELRAILHNDTSVPVSHWMHYVLAAHSGSIDTYAQKVFAHNSANVMVPNCDSVKLKTWLSALATDINSAIQSSDDPSLADELGFSDLVSKGQDASFYDWARVAILTGATEGLDSGYLDIVPLYVKEHIAEIWNSTK
ncbi:hypothetical protein [Reinekea sp. G2M2-21]|uniref:hypothetical protein n=1 Tax=Reinekea sp. G2M2-21 TaxID=2788942 RepID=UPI0018A9A50E|nr:hypothetical protein [Reinekea sp. G2M2-21]